MESTQGQTATPDEESRSGNKGPNWVVGAGSTGGADRGDAADAPYGPGGRINDVRGRIDLANYSTGSSMPAQNTFERANLQENESGIYRFVTAQCATAHTHYVSDEVGSYVGCNAGSRDGLASADYCVFCAAGIKKQKLAFLPIVDLQAQNLVFFRLTMNPDPKSLFSQLANVAMQLNGEPICARITRTSRYSYAVEPIHISANADLCDRLVDEFSKNEGQYLARKYVDSYPNRLAVEVIPKIRQSLSLIELTDEQRQTLGLA